LNLFYIPIDIDNVCGELSADERAEFESYRDENPDIQTDIEFQRNLMAARPDDNTPIDLEFGWAKLSRRRKPIS